MTTKPMSAEQFAGKMADTVGLYQNSPAKWTIWIDWIKQRDQAITAPLLERIAELETGFDDLNAQLFENKIQCVRRINHLEFALARVKSKACELSESDRWPTKINRIAKIIETVCDEALNPPTEKSA